MNVVDDVFVDLLLKLVHRGLVLRKELVGFSVSLSKSSAWLQRTKPIIIIIIIIRQFIRRRNMSESLEGCWSYPRGEVERIGERSSEDRRHWWRSITGTRTTTWWARPVRRAAGNMSRRWDPIHWLRDSQRWCLSGTWGRRTMVRSRQVWRWPTQEWRTAGITAWWILWSGYWQLLAIYWTSHNAKPRLYRHIILTLPYTWLL